MDIFRTRGFLDAVTHFSVQRTSEFLKFIVCPHGQEGGVSANILWTRAEEVNFVAILYGRLLWTAPFFVAKPHIFGKN